MPDSRQFGFRGPIKMGVLPREQTDMLSWSRRVDRAAVVDPVVNFHTVKSRRAKHDVAGGADVVHMDNLDGTGENPVIRLLTFNIQVGIQTTAYRHYVTKGWKHVLPHGARLQNLQRIAEVITDYDLVALQEIDGGSIRSGFVNQVEYLAQLGQFPYWYAQLNRDLGPIAQHGNGILSRVEPATLEDHKLPGAIPGRGAVVMRIPYAGHDLVVVMLHLSLGVRSRMRQLSYIAELIQQEKQVVVMGDMNTPIGDLLETSPLAKLSLRRAENVAPTYPAWQPELALDHILVSSNLEIREYETLDCRLSDHLPIGVKIAARVA